MTKQIPVSFKNHKGLLLRGVVHVPKRYDTAVVFLHGFPGDMSGTPRRVCNKLAKLSYLCLRFNFSGTHNSGGRFEDKLMSEEVKDTKAAIDYITKHYPTKKLVLIGNSTGAIDASLYSYKDKRISGLILWGPVSYLDQAARYDFKDRQVRDFWIKGWTYQVPRKSKKKRVWAIPNKGKIKKAFYDEFFTLDIPRAIRRYKRPLLIIHGEKDEAIPVAKDPVELYKLANKPKKLVVIKGASHTSKRPEHLKKTIEAMHTFIRKL